jgi:hypothetical protein
LTNENKALAAKYLKRQFAKSPRKSHLAFLPHRFKNWHLGAEADFVTALIDLPRQLKNPL